MIGSTVETDLIGETLEVLNGRWLNDKYTQQVTARGRCRAVTTTAGGSMKLWLEILAEGSPLPAGHASYADTLNVGDIFCVFLENSHVLRLLRSAQ